MVRRKPSWPWKAPNSAELEHFDVAFAVKEYIQNQTGQALKELETMEWSDWTREDLTACSSAQQAEWKKRLEKEYPEMLSGPHGATIRKDKWLPIYILHATIPRNRLRNCPYGTKLRICTVLWHHSSGRTGLTFYNNHLDKSARFETFVVDGATTSRRNYFAIGEKGKGFILATQWLFENILKREPFAEETSNKSQEIKLGVSFRVGHRVGDLRWKKNRQGEREQLKVTMDDLTPLTVDDLLKQSKDLDDNNPDIDSNEELYEDSSPKASSIISGAERQKAQRFLTRVYDRRRRYMMGAKRPGQPPGGYCDPRWEQSLVDTDEVAITILGLSDELTPSAVFRGIYGIVPMPASWRIPGTQIEFYKPAQNSRAEFYLRNQFVPGGPSLNCLGINYHGKLDITADRVAILTRGDKFSHYRNCLKKAAHGAFTPEFSNLAEEIARDILKDDRASGASIGHVLIPLDSEHGDEYRIAFERAWRALDEQLPGDTPLFPYQQSSVHDLNLIEELGMKGRLVPEHVMRILRDSGAFTTIQEHAGTILKQAAIFTEEVPGFSVLRKVLHLLLPEIESDGIKMHNYQYSKPRAVFDKTRKTFSFGVPKLCDAHRDCPDQCRCWIGLYLSDAIKSYEHITGSNDGLRSSYVFWRAYNECIKKPAGSSRPRRQTQTRPVAETSMHVDRSPSSSPEPHPDISSGFSAEDQQTQKSSLPARPSPVREPSPSPQHVMPPLQRPTLSPPLSSHSQRSPPGEAQTHPSQVTTRVNVGPTLSGSDLDDLCAAEALIRSAKASFLQEQDRAKSAQEHLGLARDALNGEQERTNRLQLDLEHARQETSHFRTEAEESRGQNAKLYIDIEAERKKERRLGSQTSTS